MAVTRVSFVAGERGEWRVNSVRAVVGDTLPSALTLSRLEGADFAQVPDAPFCLNGVRSNERYLEASEKKQLVSVQEDLGRPASTCAVLIPMRKSPAWWLLSQDERRAIFEHKSHHIAVGREYLPAIARRLYHCRDLGGEFDFLTWFEFSPDVQERFDHLLQRLRATEEWRFVDREVQIRLTRNV